MRFAAVLLLAGCAAAPAERLATAERIAAAAGLSARHYPGGALQAGPVPAGPVPIAGWLRRGGDGPLSVYIEGDGRAWVSRRQPADDPTPVEPVGLRLAAADRGSRVLYLARPCQYVDAVRQPGCDLRLWTVARFAPGVVAALGQAIDDAKRETAATRIRLIGYSGGGTVAAVLATQRDDVDRLVTVASPLDIEAWTTAHRVAPLTGSINPIDAVERLRPVPQLHLVGERDAVVPPDLALAIAARAGLPPPRVVPGLAHDGDWAVVWAGVEK